MATFTLTSEVTVMYVIFYMASDADFAQLGCTSLGFHMTLFALGLEVSSIQNKTCR